MATKYVNISISDLEPRKRLQFPIYAQAKGSDKFILYTKRGKILTDEMREKMKRRTKFSYFIDAADIERFRNYLFNIVQTTEKPKQRQRVIRRVHEAIALEEAFEQERRQPEFGKFPFVWWGLGIILIAMLCANIGASPVTAIVIGALGGLAMSIILLGLALAPWAEEKEEGTAAQTSISCPHCRNQIPAPPVKCRFCGKQVMGPETPVSQAPAPAPGVGPRINASIPPPPPPPPTAGPPPPASRGRGKAAPPGAEPAQHRTTVGPPNGMGLATGGVAPI